MVKVVEHEMRHVMARPSKFVQPRKQLILRLLAAGASRRHAAEASGINHATLYRWLQRGRAAAPGTAYRRFAIDLLAAEAQPRLQALDLSPEAAMRFLEDVGEFDPPPLPASWGPTIQLTFAKPPDDPRS
jgi:hypothetical protein